KHDSSRLDDIGGHKLRFANNGDNNIRGVYDSFEAPGPAVTDGYGRICSRTTLNQQHGHWLSYDLTASQNHSVFSSCLHFGGEDHLLNSIGRTGQVAGTSLNDQTYIFRMKRIHIF